MDHVRYVQAAKSATTTAKIAMRTHMALGPNDGEERGSSSPTGGPLHCKLVGSRQRGCYTPSVSPWMLYGSYQGTTILMKEDS